MLRAVIWILAGSSIVVALASSCSPSVPKPLDTSSYPSASTSAEPLFITNMPAASASTTR